MPPPWLHTIRGWLKIKMAFFFKVYKKTFDNFRLQKKIHFFCAILKHQSEAWRCCHNICKSLEIFWDQQEKIALFMFRFFFTGAFTMEGNRKYLPCLAFFSSHWESCVPLAPSALVFLLPPALFSPAAKVSNLQQNQ